MDPLQSFESPARRPPGPAAAVGRTRGVPCDDEEPGTTRYRPRARRARDSASIPSTGSNSSDRKRRLSSAQFKRLGWVASSRVMTSSYVSSPDLSIPRSNRVRRLTATVVLMHRCQRYDRYNDADVKGDTGAEGLAKLISSSVPCSLTRGFQGAGVRTCWKGVNSPRGGVLNLLGS